MTWVDRVDIGPLHLLVDDDKVRNAEDPKTGILDIGLEHDDEAAAFQL
ncbi:hypothetical protein [Streptomyces luteireticuli]